MRYLVLSLALLVAPIVVGQEAPSSQSTSTSTHLAPLLPDGSFIREAGGTLHREHPKRPWVFTIGGEDGHPARQELYLLPSHLLEEIELETADRDGQDIQFTLSGQVLLYRNRNYLILQHVEMETDHAQRPGSQLPTSTGDVPVGVTEEEDVEPENSENTGSPWDDEDDDFGIVDQGDSVAAIVAQLKEDIGPLKQSVDRTSDLSASPEGAREGTLLLSRRGRITRGPHGAWIVVFDADAHGLFDPPMVLLPSEALGQLEARIRSRTLNSGLTRSGRSGLSTAGRSGMDSAVLISGEVYSYRGRHFLLPTAWRSPVERPNLK